MIADEMPASRDVPHESRPAIGVLPRDEKHGGLTKVGEQLEQSRCRIGMRAVIEREDRTASRESRHDGKRSR